MLFKSTRLLQLCSVYRNMDSVCFFTEDRNIVVVRAASLPHVPVDAPILVQPSFESTSHRFAQGSELVPPNMVLLLPQGIHCPRLL